MEEGGLDPILRGLFSLPAKFSNQGLAEDLTERLFEVAHTVALDLGALNIQRGRDHGLPGYPAWLEWCGLASEVTWTSVRDLITDPEAVRTLREVYGHPATSTSGSGSASSSRKGCLVKETARWRQILMRLYENLNHSFVKFSS